MSDTTKTTFNVIEAEIVDQALVLTSDEMDTIDMDIANAPLLLNGWDGKTELLCEVPVWNFPHIRIPVVVMKILSHKWALHNLDTVS